MSRLRLRPTPGQELVLLDHCAHARFVWNLAVELHAHRRPGRKRPPTFAEQCRQLTEARQEFAWLAAGSVIVQQQALKDFHQAMSNYFRGRSGRPSWRTRGRHDGFRIVAAKPGDVRRCSRHVGEVKIPKVGWVRFRWSRSPPNAPSYRVTRDRAGRWHVAFAAVPAPIPPPGNGEIVGVDRGVTVSAALSIGELLTVPAQRRTEKQRLRRLERRFARDAKALESQAAYAGRSCGFTGNADVNAARNIRYAAGHAVSARGGTPLGGPVNREPQPVLLSVQERVEIPCR